jgi:recombination protein RecT
MTRKTEKNIVESEVNALAGLCNKYADRIRSTLPAHISPEKMLTLVYNEIRRVPKLKQCSQESLIGAMLLAAQTGLQIGSALGECYILPYWNSRTKCNDATFVLGYLGMKQLAYRSGLVSSFSMRCVHERDKFSYEYGTNEHIVHVPADDAEGRLTHAYAVCNLVNGGRLIHVLNKKQIDAASTGKNVWKSYPEEMAQKTAFRRLFKLLPVSTEIQTAIRADEYADSCAQSALYEHVFASDDKSVTQSISDDLASYEQLMGGEISTDELQAVADNDLPKTHSL